MSIKRLSVSIPDHVEESIRLAAAEAGVSVSAWLTQAAERAVAEQGRLRDGLAALAEWEAASGPLDPAAVERARQELVAAGAIPDQATR